MKNPFKQFHFTTQVVVLCAALVSAAHATVIYSTLGPGGTFDTNNSVHVGALLLNTGAYGDNFTSPVTTTVGSVTLAVGEGLLNPPAITVAIHSNTPTGPGGVLGFFNASVIPSGPELVTFSSSIGVHLVAGTQYWLTMAAQPVQGIPSDGANWFLNNQGIDNVIANRASGQWTVDGSSTALAFELDTVPEPGSTTLCALSIVVAYLWRKRRL